MKPIDDPEVLCLKCGRCCYAKEHRPDGFYISKIPCPFLDTETKLCRVYDERHAVAPWCRNPLEVLEFDPCLPADCPIAVRYGPPGYTGCKEDK